MCVIALDSVDSAFKLSSSTAYKDVVEALYTKIGSSEGCKSLDKASGVDSHSPHLLWYIFAVATSVIFAGQSMHTSP